MKLLPFGLGLLSLVVMVAPARAENWVSLGVSHQKSMVELNQDSIESNGTRRFYVFREFFTRPRNDGAEVSVAEVETDCTTRQSRMHQVALYKLDGTKLRHAKATAPWLTLRPGTTGYTLYEQVCR